MSLSVKVKTPADEVFELQGEFQNPPPARLTTIAQ